MRARGLFGLALLIACEAPAGSASEQAPVLSSVTSTGATPKSQREPPTDAIEQTPAEPDVLPPVAEGWAPPHLESESGKCWVKVHRLSDAQIEAVRREFLARNPGWELNPIHVDPFTGVVDNASHFRKMVGPAAPLPDELFALRRLAPLRRNADLIGLTGSELDHLTWEPGSFHGNTSDQSGSTPNALLGCRPGPNAHADRPHCGNVVVRFQRDGVVSGFGVRRQEPPAQLCREPSIGKEQARHSRGLFDASAQPKMLGYFGSGMTVKPNEVGNARLGVDMYLEDGQPTTRARSVTWRLVWEVDVRAAMWTFLVDATTGKTVGLRRNYIQ